MAANLNFLSGNGNLDTTTAAFFGIVQFPTTLNGSGSIVMPLVVRRKSDGASQAWTFQGGYKNINGVVTAAGSLVGAIQGSSADKTALNATQVRIVVDGSALRVEVAGINGVALMWAASLTGIEVYDM